MLKQIIRIIIIILLASISFAIGKFIYSKFQSEPQDPTPIIVYPSELLNHFYYDNIVLFGNDNFGKPFLVEFMLGRKQKDYEEYDHYYTVHYKFFDENSITGTSFVSPSKDVILDKFFESYNNYKFPDDSTRENFDITLKIANRNFVINISDINGDFISKNSYDYIRFVSSGKAKVKINDNEFYVNALVDKIYSDNYTKSIFFENANKLSSRTQSLLLWDENNNFYLIDMTSVDNDDLPYKTHNWILYKDAEGNYTRKFFDAELEFSQDSDGPSHWVIKIPGLDQTEIELDRDSFTNFNPYQGIASGEVRDKRGERKISGQFTYQVETPD